MAKQATDKGRKVRRQGRRVMPALRRGARRARAKAERGPLTLGEVIAAAFETSAGELGEVLALVTSPQMTRALGRRIVLES
ncbi:hypothetical protein KRR26_28170 [Corallococcus sp. M34]|uniref:hypothetical protein n=1 Tax=Citreicoccus inhibens TaxID=2849499 RepID=UPI0018F6B3AF|nr:hypothetical protein [Citreicoccus inhibens]MBU8899498.1 hypothetical protein [Citreicoccus inhibens]